ncbi:MAG: hypothetical protein MRY83_19610 [Flavobacteriales bacterium]|nr:hypothetical protein [Flavobacteriales bacterium]
MQDPKENKVDDEISLQDLRLFLYKTLLTIEGVFTFFWSIFKKKLLLLILFLAIGAGIGFGIHKLSKNAYYAQMTISYYELHNKIYGDMISKLNSLVKNKNYTSVSQLLELPIETCLALKKIEAFNVRNEPLFEDLSFNKSPISISIKITDPTLAKDFQNAIIKYLETNRFIASRKALQTKNLKQELAYVVDKIQVIENLLNNPELLSSSSKKDEEVSTISDLLQKSREYFSRKLDIESTLEIDKKIEVIDDAVVIQHPTYGSPLKMTILGAAVFFALGFLLLSAKTYKKQAQEEFGNDI